jgi:hypothetical protein
MLFGQKENVTWYGLAVNTTALSPKRTWWAFGLFIVGLCGD